VLNDTPVIQRFTMISTPTINRTIKSTDPSSVPKRSSVNLRTVQDGWSWTNDYS